MPLFFRLVEKMLVSLSSCSNEPPWIYLKKREEEANLARQNKPVNLVTKFYAIHSSEPSFSSHITLRSNESEAVSTSDPESFLGPRAETLIK